MHVYSKARKCDIVKNTNEKISFTLFHIFQNHIKSIQKKTFSLIPQANAIIIITKIQNIITTSVAAFVIYF